MVSDVLGYFAGRTFGGPKFWPAISPKKTWSGTIAGWIGAVIWALIMVLVTGSGDFACDVPEPVWSSNVGGDVVCWLDQYATSATNANSKR